jgi:hypothetical protein
MSFWSRGYHRMLVDPDYRHLTAIVCEEVRSVAIRIVDCVGRFGSPLSENALS